MKNKAICIILAALVCQAFTLQSNETINPQSNKRVKVSDTTDVASVTIGKDLLHIENSDSVFTLRIKDKGISILESLEGRKIEFENNDLLSDKAETESEDSSFGNNEFKSDSNVEDNVEDDLKDDPDYYSHHESGNYWDDEFEENNHDHGARHFRGHLAGIEVGFNNFNYLRSNTLPNHISYMELDESSSYCFNINFSQINIGFSRHIGIVAGLGLNWSNYRFDGENTIGVGASGTIVELLSGSTVPLKKSKFSTLYLNVPALLEIQIPAGYNRLNIAAGVIGGIKLNAWTKMVFEDKNKSRENGDYNLNLLRGGVTARAGYKNFMLYGTYYLTPWFKDNKGPNGLNLEPFEIGLAFTFND